MQSQRPRCSSRSAFHLFLLAASSAIACINVAQTHAADWPGFRGPTGNGLSYEKEVFVGADGFSLEIAWKRELGSGYSGVAIADGTVVTAFSDGKADVVIAMDELTGEERWRFTLDETYSGHDGSHTGPIATPLIADGRVFMLAPRGRLFAIKLESGKKLWFTDLVKKYGASQPHYGFTTSPFMHEGVLIVEVGGEDASVVGIDPRKGRKLWGAGEGKVDYQSPVLATVRGKAQIVLANNKKLYGLDAKTGKSLWEYNHAGSGAIGSSSLVPVPCGEDMLFLSHKGDESMVVAIKRTGNRMEAERLWKNRNIRNSYNAPVYHDGHIYAYSSRFLTCVDAKTGENKWRSRQPGDGFTILVDGHIVILTKKGSVHVAKATPNGYEEMAGLTALTDQAWAPPSFANGHIVVRGFSEIARIAIRSGADTGMSTGTVASGSGSSNFARFLKEVESVTSKKDVVDQFMKANKQLPITEEGQVHFVYRGKGDDLAVGSDLFGARQERAMQRIDGTDFFYCSAPLESDARVNYIFIRDYEDHLTDPLNPRKTMTSIFGKEMEMSFGSGTMEMSWFAMPEWKAPTYFETPPRSKRGRVQEQQMKSKLVGKPIKLGVYLPAGYKKTGDRLPVAYVHSGTGALERGDVPKALDNLIGKTVSPLIVVFIKFSPPMFGPNKYPEMFVEELIPFIDEKYHTIAKPAGRASIGAGFGGSLALTSAFAGSIPVDKVGCLSPFLFGVTEEQIAERLKSAKNRKFHVYIDWGKYDFRNPQEAWNMAKSAEAFSKMMRNNGCTVTGGEHHEGTGWSTWRNRLDRIFGALFAKS